MICDVLAAVPDAPLDRINIESMGSAVQAYVNTPAHYQSKIVPISEAIITNGGGAAGDGISHTFFAGGKGSINERHINKLSLLYALDILCKDQALYLLTNQIERALPSFPLFFDIDLRVVSRQHDIEQLHNDYFRLLVSAVARFYPDMMPADEKLLLLVCARPALADGEAIKYGYHAHFPHLRVTVESALQIREATVAAFLEKYDERVTDGENSWCDVFDVSVFKGSRGLRSCGSYKMKRATASAADELHGRVCTQKDPHGRPVTYWPHVAMRGDGSVHDAWQGKIDTHFPANDMFAGRSPAALLHRRELRRFFDDTAMQEYILGFTQLVNMTRVRAYGAVTPGFVVYDGAPRPGAMLRKRIHSGAAADSLRKLARAPKRPRGTAAYTAVADDGLRRLTTAYLRQLCDASGRRFWPTIRVAQMWVKENPKRGDQQMLVAVTGEGSSRCLNLACKSGSMRRGGDHTSNHIFFWIGNTPPYVSQRCHSKNAVRAGHTYQLGAGRAIPCSQFSSSKIEPPAVHGTRPPPEMLRCLDNMVRFDAIVPAKRSEASPQRRLADLAEFLGTEAPVSE